MNAHKLGDAFLEYINCRPDCQALTTTGLTAKGLTQAASSSAASATHSHLQAVAHNHQQPRMPAMPAQPPPLPDAVSDETAPPQPRIQDLAPVPDQVAASHWGAPSQRRIQDPAPIPDQDDDEETWLRWKWEGHTWYGFVCEGHACQGQCLLKKATPMECPRVCKGRFFGPCSSDAFASMAEQEPNAHFFEERPGKWQREYYWDSAGQRLTWWWNSETHKWFHTLYLDKYDILRHA